MKQIFLKQQLWYGALSHTRSIRRSIRTTANVFFDKSYPPITTMDPPTSIPKSGTCYDFTIVGGGIIGCATALVLSKKYPNMKIAIIEKEPFLGIYYTPGSLKAKLCVEGMRLSYEYFSKNEIPYKKCGKLIVAVRQDEVVRLKDLYKRGLENNVPHLKLVDGQEIRKFEPHCQGLMAIWSPETGIVDWSGVTKSYANNFAKAGGQIHTNFTVIKFQRAAEGQEYPVLIFSKDGKNIRTKYALTCAGLHSDKLAQLSQGEKYPAIIPFRGEYLVLSSDKSHLINGNIYPVPDARFPFLGFLNFSDFRSPPETCVHFTPRMDGSVLLGPNALLAFKREGYSWKDFDIRDLTDVVRNKGFQKMARKYLGFGLGEMWRSVFINFQLSALHEYIPEIDAIDVKRGPAGVRAQAMNDDGSLVDDFVFDSGKGELSDRILHVRNAPSPAATSSLAIANMIVEKVTVNFSL